MDEINTYFIKILVLPNLTLQDNTYITLTCPSLYITNLQIVHFCIYRDTYAAVKLFTAVYMRQ